MEKTKEKDDRNSKEIIECICNEYIENEVIRLFISTSFNAAMELLEVKDKTAHNLLDVGIKIYLPKAELAVKLRERNIKNSELDNEIAELQQRLLEM